MGIKRCPYCRALISDEDQYCKNCGTQLLFPEDEEIEEEIPGDKIVEDNRQRDTTEDLTEEEFEENLEDLENKEKEEELAEEKEEKLEVLKEEEAKEEIEEGEEEVILVDEETSEQEIEKETGETKVFSRAMTKAPTTEEILFAFEEEKLPFPEEKGTGELESATEFTEKTEGEDLIKKIEKEILEEEIREMEKKAETQPQEGKTPGLVTQIVQELGVEEKAKRKKEIIAEENQDKLTAGKETIIKREERASDSATFTFETAELGKIGPTVELGKRQVEDFFKILEEKEKQRLKEKARQLEKSNPEEPGEIPSWIKEVQTADLKTGSTELIKPAVETTETKETGMIETGTGEEWLEEETASEPTMGFPERVTRSQIEIEKEEEYLGEEEMELEEQIGEEETEKEYIYQESAETATLHQREVSRGEFGEETLPPLGFKNFVKAKIFDLLFIIVFWLVSIWLAARSMNVTIFKLLDVATNGLLIYLLILTVFYFFLFYFFIGETLGDRLFREGEEEEHF
ncbi:MAG: zinc ribbon domain-containing protein [Candidatus Aminicenantes bacterium]|nr:zinc ribbon domain-containing protein [Candidatus Aminicenantes bacterium]